MFFFHLLSKTSADCVASLKPQEAVASALRVPIEMSRTSIWVEKIYQGRKGSLKSDTYFMKMIRMFEYPYVNHF